MTKIKVSQKGIPYAKPKVLKAKKTVFSQAILMKIPRENNESPYYSLKIGRYRNFIETPETLNPKSELTLDNDELNSLIDYISENYAPIRLGEGDYIDISGGNEKLITSFKKLLDREKDAAALLLKTGVLSENVLLAASTIARREALEFFKKNLDEDKPESFWQKWFEKNKWVLGTDFAEIIDERNIDTKHIADYLTCAYDGFVDIVEIKKPNGIPFWASSMDHGNYVPSTELVQAITQCQNYLYAIEKRSNDAEFQERTNSKVIKPRCVLVFGRSKDWNDEQREAYRILDSSYTQLSILTYDHLLVRAENVLGIANSSNQI